MRDLKVEGAKIIYFRKMKGISQKSLAAQIGISRQYLSKIENGLIECDKEILKKILSILEISRLGE